MKQNPFVKRAAPFFVAAAAAAIGVELQKTYLNRKDASLPAENSALSSPKRRPCVLITGGSSGLGLELARLYAGDQYEIILAARNLKKLEQAKESLLQEQSIPIHLCPVDLADPKGAQQLYRKIRDELKKEVDVLINNAGAAAAGTLVETEPALLESLIQLNVTAPTLLCRYFGADMAARGQGTILNVCSIASFMPDPWLNVYGPCKAFDFSLSETLIAELKGSGVFVSALYPGTLSTPFNQQAGRTKSSGFEMDPAKAARIAYEGLARKETCIIPGLPSQAYALFLKFAPVSLKRELAAAFQKHLLDS